MSGLFDALSSATTGLAASELGLEVAGQNLANINTVGYSRRTVDLAELPGSSNLQPGRGVDVVGVEAVRDQFAQAQIWNQQPAGSYQDAIVSSLTNVNAAVGLPGAGLDSQLGSFFDSFATLATDPTSVSARDEVVSQGQTLASGFNQMAGQLTATQQNADQTIGSDIQQINQLTTQIAQLNGQISNDGADVESLKDARNVAITTLSGLAGVNVMQNPDGSTDLTIGQGRPLVIGTQAYALTGVPSGSQGFLSVTDNGTDITSELKTGDIGGQLNVRDTIVPGYQNQLDQIAYSVATQVNAASQAGFDGSGNAGGNFFVAPSGVAGAAAALTVNPAVAADGSLVVASSTGAAGDNGAATAISDLRNATIVGGSTPDDAWGQLVFQVGSDVSTATSASTSNGEIVQQLQSLQAQASGVSMDEEATNLMKFQRSYEASARFFTTVDATLDTLMNMVQ